MGLGARGPVADAAFTAQVDRTTAVCALQAVLSAGSSAGLAQMAKARANEARATHLDWSSDIARGSPDCAPSCWCSICARA